MKQVALFLVLFCCGALSAQAQSLSITDYEKRQEKFVKQFYKDYETNYELRHEVEHLFHNHGEELDQRKLERVKRLYAKHKFQNQNKEEFNALFNPNNSRMAGDVCENGGFESGFDTYDAEVADYFSDLNDLTCDNTLNFVDFDVNSNPLRFSIVDNSISDPLVGIDRTHGGDHAAMINNFHGHEDLCDGDFGVDKLVKEFMVTEENRNFTVWYAVVLEDPDNHEGRRPFLFMECDLALQDYCFNPDNLGDPENISAEDCFYGSVRHLDWDCVNFTIPTDQIGEMTRLEITVGDCGRGAHMGYAYIDDICEPCTDGSLGSIMLNPPPECTGFPVTICGTYELPSTPGNWTVSSIDVNADIQNLIDNGDGTFCFELLPSNYDGVDCIDIIASITFNDGTSDSDPRFSNAINLCLDDIICDNCLSVTVLEVNCFNQGTTDPSDDSWNFVIQVEDLNGTGVYWTTSGDVIENGSYGPPKTIWLSGTIASLPSVTFTVFDAVNPECYVTLTVDAPPPCSDPCDLNVEYEVSECDDNGTPNNVSDDFYTVTIDVSGTNGLPWMVKQKFDGGAENLVYQGTGDETITLTFLSQDGDFTLWVFLSDYFDCLIDFYVDAPTTCSGCLDVVVTNLTCYDNGTSDPTDDYWTFDIEVNGGNGYWTAGAPINDSGSYGDPKTIWVGPINGDITFTITDNEDADCAVEVTVSPPEPCSIKCDLEVTELITECKEIEGSLYYVLSLNVAVEGDQCFMVKRKNADGSEQVLGTYNGSQTLTYGPFNQGEEFTLWVMLCETFDCVRDFYIQAPDDCENCINYSISNITCYDNGTSDTSDDYWTFDIIANGPGSYWTAGWPINDSGSYGSTKTIWVGNIQSNPSVNFTIYDNEVDGCFANVSVQAPEPCSVECKLEVSAKTSECKYLEGQAYFYITLDVTTLDGLCWMVKKKNLDGSEEVLGTYYGSQTVTLGPFPAGEDFTLWVMGCELFDCTRDFYITAPDCSKDGDGKKRIETNLSSDISLSPNPVQSVLTIETIAKVDARFSVFNLDGQKVTTGNLVKGFGRLDVQDIHEGIYFISIPQTDGTQLIKRFIVVK